MALAFVTSRPFVNSTLIGATNMQQLKSNIDSISLKLSVEVLDDIEKIRRNYPMPY
ncbi:MAG: aldo/keto reductase [Thiohalomonadales bacterium]